MNRGKRRFGITDVLLLVLNLIFFAAIQTVFAPCEARPDGTWMPCHHTGEAIAGVAAVLAAMALLHLIIPRAHIKCGLAIAMIPVSLLALLLPGHLMDLCMMDQMRCHTVTAPAVTSIALLDIMLAAADIYVYRKGDAA